MSHDHTPPTPERIALTGEERAALERIVAIGNRYAIRRARLLLMSASGLGAAEIAEQLALSQRRVRYWQRAFSRRRLGVFSERLLARVQALSSGAQDQVGETGEIGANPLNIETAVAPPAKVEAARAPVAPGVVQPRCPLRLDKTPGVGPGDPMSEAGRKVLCFHFERMLQHEPGARLGEDIEALHDMRVTTRRMRAAFDVFGEFYKARVLKKHLKGLRAAGRALGAVRDLDVFMEKVARYQASLPETGRGGLEPLLEAWAARRERARAALIAHLDSEAFARFVEDFADFLATPGAGAKDAGALVRHVAPRLIYSCLEAVRRYETVIDTASVETLHALRIAFKRFRYTLEFFEEVLGPEAREVIEAVKVVQDHLGDLNDAHVAEGILREFAADYEQRQAGVQIAQRRSIDRVIQYMADRAAEKHRLMVTFPEAWAHFTRAEVRRALAAAVAIL